MPADSPIRFAKCERDLAFLASIDAHDLQALLRLRLHAWATEPTSRQVADLLGCSLRTAKTRCLSLYRRGLLTVTFGSRGTSHWRVEQPLSQWLRVPAAWVTDLPAELLRVLVAAAAASFWSAGWERHHRLEVANAAALARSLGCHRSTVLRALAAAEALGALEVADGVLGVYQLTKEAQTATWGRVAGPARVADPDVASVAQVAAPTCAGELPGPENEPLDAAPSPGAGERAVATQPPGPPLPPLRRCSRECHGQHELGRWTRREGRCLHCGGELVLVSEVA